MTRRLDELNALEEAEAERVSGRPITDLEDEDAPKVKIFAGLAFVHRRRTEPKLTFNEFMKNGRMREFVNYVLGDSEDDADPAVEEAEEDPFPSGGAAEAPAAVESGPADAEGPVLHRHGSEPV